MLSPVGLPPPLPLPRDPELVAATERAIAVPASVGASARWEVGSVLTASVRFQDDEMLLKVGDHFFSSRPIPGVSEYSRLSLQVARDMSGALTLVPLLPLAGTSVARIGGVPSPAGRVMAPGSAPPDEAAPIVESTVPSLPAPVPSRLGANPVRSLSARLHLPSALSQWLLGPEGVASPSASTAVPTLPTLSSWMQSLAASLSQSGLFFESQLREHRPVPVADLKRRLLEYIETQREGSSSAKAWAALDDLVGLQSAATAANRSGGTVYSFVAPSPDGLGGWWITLQQDSSGKPLDYAGGDGRRDDQQRPWRTRLVGVSLPFGDIDIRIEQVGRSGVGVTVLTDTADQQARWDESKTELSRRLQGAGLELARFSV
ncbi:MAG: hypothetical protein ACKO42_02145, partial [Gammaproteobacteria bacterium]